MFSLVWLLKNFGVSETDMTKMGFLQAVSEIPKHDNKWTQVCPFRIVPTPWERWSANLAARSNCGSPMPRRWLSYRRNTTG